MSANTGVLGSATVVTDTTGTATVTFSSGSSKINRTATITATSGAVSAQIPVQIVGSTVTVNSAGATLPDDGSSPVTLTITAMDFGGNIVPNAAVALSKTGTGNVTLTPASGTTDASGQLTVTARGVAGGAGTATISATALGATATTALTVSPTAATFSIDQQTLNGTVVTGNPAVTAMRIGQSLAVRVNAPTSTSVTFATTTGLWNGAAPVVAVPVAGGSATATLTTTQAGVATVQVYDTSVPTTSDSLTVTMTSATAASITIQATPSVVPRSVGTTTGSSTLIAMVRDASGSPVGGVPVAFSIVNPTGGGETISPVVVLSAATTAGGLNLGEARSSFTSGSASSSAGGVKIRASVVGTTVATNLAPSGNDVAVVIGGTAGSVAFGMATAIAIDASTANYVLDMSVLVADSNGNPAPLGTVVNLSIWPIAWSTGGGCTVDADAMATPAVDGVAATGTSRVGGDLLVTSLTSSDVGNGITVTIEQDNTINTIAYGSWTGTRSFVVKFDGDSHPSTWAQIASAVSSWSNIIRAVSPNNGSDEVVAGDAQIITLAGGVAAVTATFNKGTFYNEDINENLILDAGEDGKRTYYFGGGSVVGGAVNGALTAGNSAAGSVPATVSTDASGVAAFKLTYPKLSAIWNIARIRGRTVVQGSETVGEIAFRLTPLESDVIPTCRLPNSTYTF